MDNKTLEIMKTRRSVRGFIPGKLPENSLIDKVIEAGTYAPTGRGKQSPVIVAVTNKKTRDLLSKLNAEVLGVSSDPFYGAPVVLVVLADKSVPTYIYDGSLVMKPCHGQSDECCRFSWNRKLLDSSCKRGIRVGAR